MIASVAAGCEYNYGAMGRVGFLYESMKDRLKWSKLSVKHYIRMLSQIGQILCLGDEDYKKEKAKATKQSSSAIENALKSAFGDER